MKILYISYDGMTDPLGQSQVLPYLQGISKAGYEITLLSCEKPDRLKKKREEIETICAGSSIRWVPITYTKKPPIVSTLYDVGRLQRKAEQLYKKYRYSIVHCRSYISSIVGLRLKEKYGAKFIFDMRGFWADERVDGGLWKLNNLIYKSIYKFFKKKETRFLNEADYIISLTQNAANEIHSWKNIIDQPVPVEIIPCCADLNLFNRNSIDNSKIELLKAELNIYPGQFVLSYVGSLGTWYLLPEMLDFFKLLLQHKPEAVFLFITNDPGEYIYNKAHEKQILREKIIITRSERKLMPLYISISSFNIFFVKPTFSKKASSPVKQGEVMGMGIPIICNAGVGDTDDIIKSSSAGIVISEFNSASYETAIQMMDKIEFKPENIIAGAQRFYSLEDGIKKYLRVYRNITA